MRRAGARAKNGRVQNWIISEGGRDRLVRELSDDEKRLPIGAIVNDTLLAERISSGWSPEDEV
jgi:hypothetical protein